LASSASDSLLYLIVNIAASEQTALPDRQNFFQRKNGVPALICPSVQYAPHLFLTPSSLPLANRTVLRYGNEKICGKTLA
jgi:hypothetical protein